MLSQRFSQFVIFEDAVARSRRFLPITYTRPASLLRAGMYTPLERLALFVPRQMIVLHTSEALKRATAERNSLRVNELDPGKPTLLINARLFFAGELSTALARYEANGAMLSESGDLLAACFDIVPEAVVNAITNGDAIDGNIPGLNGHKVAAKCFDSLWSMLHYNGEAIRQDVELTRAFGKLDRYGNGERSGVLANKPNQISIHETATVGLGVVLDAGDGPIVIEEGAKIFPQATIMGPCVIGKNSVMKIGAKVYEGTTIGPVCKVGGEIENSIVLAYSNKQHDGYLGHSYLGEWVNLGADTNTSDLKNDYSPVKVFPENEGIDTGSLFVGLMMGDHSKSAINTQFNTGTVVGVSSNIFEAGFPPKWIPSFSWGGGEKSVEYKFDKAISVARIVTKRRNIELLDSEAEVLRGISERRID